MDRSVSWCALLCLLPGLAASALSADQAQLRVVYDGDQKPVAVEFVGAGARQAGDASPGLLAVYVVESGDRRSEQALAGRVSAAQDAVRFTPQFAFRPGLTYEAVCSPDAAKPLTLRFAAPAPPAAEPTRVVAVYPSRDVLPDNHLRFYLHFSAPMSFGEAYTHIKLLAADGGEVKRAFLEIGEELWDATGTRLTLLFDPGRVKKGLLPRDEFGPVLMDGKAYRLVIDKNWRDANGNELVAGFEKAFRAGPPVETAVDHKKWQITPPAAGTRDALTIRFDRPLDHALLFRMIGVTRGGDQRLDGDITVGDAERRWQFRPDEPWQPGPHELVIDTALEDCAGNNLARPFEVDVFDRVDSTSAPFLLRIPFETKE